MSTPLTDDLAEPIATDTAAASTPTALRMQVNIHAFNEAPTIARVIEQIPRQIPGVARVRIIVIDDGSTDDTAARARAGGAEVLSLGRNHGLGQAFGAGLRAAARDRADLLVTLDGDGQFDPSQIPQLIAPILVGQAEMTTASRFKDPQLTPQMPAVKRIGNHMVAALVSNMTGQRLHDVSCGFRAYNAECLLRLNLMGRFTYTHEAIMELVFKGMRVVEVPLPVRGVREHGQSRMASNVLKYGYRTFRIMIGTVLNHRPHHFFGALAALSFVLGVGLAIAGSVTWVTENTFIKSLMFMGGFFVGLSVLLTLFGFQARVLHRSQFLLENILLETRTRHDERD